MFGVLFFVSLSLSLFLVFRLIQRLYFILRNPPYSSETKYSPSIRFKRFLDRNSIEYKKEKFISNHNGHKVVVWYAKIGSGDKSVLLLNGVGTPLFMWLPVLERVIQMNPYFFKEFSLYSPCYRGLFGSLLSHHREHDDDYLKTDENSHLPINSELCANDVTQLMAHEGIKRFEIAVCWSLGAQMALECFSQKNNEKLVKKLFLLSPATGNVLQRSLQPFFPLPLFISSYIRLTMISILLFLRGLIKTKIFDVLKAFVQSKSFYYLLAFGDFLGGLNSLQTDFAYEYMLETFRSRFHVRGLVDLILSLDSHCSQEALSLSHPTLILSGVPDGLTNIYHSRKLKESMANAEIIEFTMGSHFILFEWPELVAKHFLTHLLSEQKTQVKN